MDAVQISLSGLDVEWRRLEVAALNLANINTTRDAAGATFRPQTLVSGPAAPFGALLAQGQTITPGAPSGVAVLGVEAQSDPVHRRYEPAHPHADADGYVTYPNVDHAGEMTLMIRAARAYEANLAALSLAQDMYARAAEIGRQS